MANPHPRVHGVRRDRRHDRLARISARYGIVTNRYFIFATSSSFSLFVSCTLATYFRYEFCIYEECCVHADLSVLYCSYPRDALQPPRTGLLLAGQSSCLLSLSGDPHHQLYSHRHSILSVLHLSMLFLYVQLLHSACISYHIPLLLPIR